METIGWEAQTISRNSSAMGRHSTPTFSAWIMLMVLVIVGFDPLFIMGATIVALFVTAWPGRHFVRSARV